MRSDRQHSARVNGLPLRQFVPGQVATFELACNRLWDVLTQLSVEDLKALRATGKYVPLVDSLIDVRTMMNGGVQDHPRRY